MDIKIFLFEELSKLKIKNEDKLREYINFCLDNSLTSPIKFKSSKHHILPKAKSLPFVKYKNLKDYSWNGVNLFHKDHFIAHSILAEAVLDQSISLAWHRMNITFDGIKNITPELYQKLCEEHKLFVSKIHSGVKRTIETKTKISKSLSGRKLSEDHVKKMKSVKRTESEKENLRNKCSGRKHTEDEIKKQIESQTGKKQQLVQCPHCGKIGGNVLMSRWHFDNCKMNKDFDEENSNRNKSQCPHCGKIGVHNSMKIWHFDNCGEYK